MKILCSLFLLLIPFFAWPQMTISGIVKDSVSGNPLPGATIVIENSFAAAISDPHGNFIIKNVKPGKNKIKVSYIGFSPAENISVAFHLSRSAVLADEVLISATRASVKTAMTYKNIDKSEIEKKNFC